MPVKAAVNERSAALGGVIGFDVTHRHTGEKRRFIYLRSGCRHRNGHVPGNSCEQVITAERNVAQIVMTV